MASGARVTSQRTYLHESHSALRSTRRGDPGPTEARLKDRCRFRGLGRVRCRDGVSATPPPGSPSSSMPTSPKTLTARPPLTWNPSSCPERTGNQEPTARADGGMEIILRDDPGPSDDQVVVIHMGAGAVDVAVAAALRNYRAYQAFSARGGEFTVSVFAAMAGITEDMILGAMPHPQYGRARYGGAEPLLVAAHHDPRHAGPRRRDGGPLRRHPAYRSAPVARRIRPDRSRR